MFSVPRFILKDPLRDVLLKILSEPVEATPLLPFPPAPRF